MTKINEKNNVVSWVYKIGFFIILALPILVWPPYFFPVDWGKSIVFRSVLAIIFFLYLWKFLRGKENFNWQNFIKSKIVWALGALLGFYFLASIFSVDPLFSFWGSPYRGGGLITFAFFFIFTVLSFILLKKEDWKKTWIFSIFIGVLVSLIGVIQYFKLFNNIFVGTGDRPPSTMGNTDILGLYLLLLFFITLAFTIKEKFRWKKILYFTSLVLFFYVILITGARAAYFGLVIGGIYFIFSYSKKIDLIKVTTIGLLILATIAVFYANTINQYPVFLQQNRLFNSVVSRLSIKDATNDPRFAAWQIEIKELTDKPILGWGPENLSVGFDKFYDPNTVTEPWWDRAHNILLGIGVETGILGIIAYLALFIVLFWQLQKAKNEKNNLAVHGIQATLIGYFVANFFGFDTFSTYLIFFLLIAYSLHLIYEDPTKTNIVENHNPINKVWWKSCIIFVLFIILIIFLWQYNFAPFQINTQINKDSDLVNQKQCDQALTLMDDNLKQHSFLDSYARMQYIEFTKTCAVFYPQNNLDYIKKDLELLNEAVKIQPLYTRYWLYMGAYESTLAGQENDATKKENLTKLANNDFTTALKLAPKHQEIFIDMASLQMISSNYKSSEDYSKKCISLNPSLGDCYFYLGLSQIYSKNSAEANKNIQTAKEKGYNINSETSLIKLANAYNSTSDYQSLAIIFEKLTTLNPNAIQYHSSLAFIYAKLGEYNKARQEAGKVLELSPASKQNVDEFLNTLP